MTGVGVGWTVSVADPGLPVPLFPALAATVLVLTPAVVPRTSALTTHDEPAASVPPLKVMLDDPVINVAVPPQELADAIELGAITETPAGKTSLKLKPVNGDEEFGFDRKITGQKN